MCFEVPVTNCMNYELWLWRRKEHWKALIPGNISLFLRWISHLYASSFRQL